MNLFARVVLRQCWPALMLLLFLSIGRQGAGAAVAVLIGQNFTASTFGVDSSALPPDAALAAGTNYVAQFINGRYSVFNKTNAAKVQTMTAKTFWANAGLPLAANLNLADPRILFDQGSHRWFAAMIDYDSTTGLSNRFLLAVSATADPTGTWRGVAFVADPTTGYGADFPTLGIDANAVYLGADMFNISQDLVGETLVSIPKTNLLTNPPNAAGRTWFGILNSATYGSVFQPVVTQGAGSGAETVLAMGDLGYDGQGHTTLIAFGVGNGGMPGGAVLTAPTTLTVPPYSIPFNPLQPSGLSNLDDGDARLGATVYRVGNLIFAVHSTEFNNRAALQWFEIDAGTLQVLDTGFISDPSLDLFYPSIGANASGTVVIAFNGCSLGSFVSCYAMVGEKVGGTLSFGSRILLKAGLASYTSSRRWGDYSAVSVDPVDPNRFWTLTMYPGTQTAWSTQITELITGQVRLEIAGAGTNVILCWPTVASGFQLQSRTDLFRGSWTSVTGSPVLTNNQYRMSLSSTGAARFFRLFK